MYRQAHKIINNKPYLYKFGKKSNNPCLNYLSSIKGISSQAELIVSTCDLHTLEDLLNLQVEDLSQVHGIGKTRAKQIIKKIRTAQWNTNNTNTTGYTTLKKNTARPK